MDIVCTTAIRNLHVVMYVQSSGSLGRTQGAVVGERGCAPLRQALRASSADASALRVTHSPCSFLGVGEQQKCCSTFDFDEMRRSIFFRKQQGRRAPVPLGNHPESLLEPRGIGGE